MTKLALVFVLMQIGVPLYGTTIDFESQGAGAPAVFNGRVNSPLIIGTATFSGGEVLRTVSGGADTTAVYATTNMVSGVYGDPLTITFSSPVNDVSLLLTNELPDTYTITSDTALTQSSFVNADTSYTFSLSGNGIGSVSILSSQTLQWDFAIDNVTFASPNVTTPEPATLGAMSSSLLTLWAIFALRRGNKMQFPN